MGEIYVDVKESLETFDVETADGFDPEDENETIKTDDLIETAPQAHM
jgi:hypothetical protein